MVRVLSGLELLELELVELKLLELETSGIESGRGPPHLSLALDVLRTPPSYRAGAVAAGAKGEPQIRLRSG
jgi:hypothetical protein